MRNNQPSLQGLNILFKANKKEIQCLKPQLLRILVPVLLFMLVWNLFPLLVGDPQQE